MLNTACAVHVLRSKLELLGTSDKSFAASMIAQYDKKGGLSPKQLEWVDKLIVRADTPKSHIKNVEVGGLDKLVDLFDEAKKHLAHPKIRISVDFQTYALSVAGPDAKKPGTINVTDGRPYGQNIWFGRVSVEGAYEPGRKLDNRQIMNVTTALKYIAADPAKAASEHGVLTGYCCFCNRYLDDPKSTEVGYGPVCAKKWSLPWGQKGKAV